MKTRSNRLFLFLAVISIVIVITFFGMKSFYPSPGSPKAGMMEMKDTIEKNHDTASIAQFDSATYDKSMVTMVNGDSSGKWPVKTAYPLQGALLPYKRIIAYYGNLYSKQMGILGELPKAEVLEQLSQKVNEWQKADSTTEVVPALHYIAVTAQGSPGKGGKYRLRMPFHQIDSVLNMAAKINAIVFLDIQVGLSTLQQEIPELAPYLKLPNVHLGIDPEFSMKGGQAPGKVVGKFDAADINYAASFLSKLVRDNHLPPKILVVHRFTQGMVTNYKQIKTMPEVQIVMHMDGWGHPAKKINTYRQFIYKEPVQFTGFKLFYKNDLKDNGRLLTPAELLALKPRPLYIQYQ
ncbi:MAG: hypothetical protein GC171_00050 [Terrimonas sp.]|nr:hypothetical protein [Terrimonas sp.]